METCIKCGKPSSLFCDFHIGHPIGGYVRVGTLTQNRFQAVIDCSQLSYKCDAPICEECSTRVGQFHISGKDPYTETIDHCPIHKEIRGDPAPMTNDEADALRRDIWARYRRQKIVAVTD